MRRIRIALVTVVCALCGAANSPFLLAQHGSVSVDWKAELAKARAGIKKNPRSAFWHNQAGVAYDALGDFETAVKELKLASTLDPTNPSDDYALYALYQRRGMLAQQREVLLDAIKKDPDNPFSHFELGSVLEKDHNWPEALREYGQAKLLASMVVEGYQYIDPHGHPFEIDVVRREVDKAIDRVAKMNASKQREK